MAQGSLPNSIHGASPRVASTVERGRSREIVTGDPVLGAPPILEPDPVSNDRAVGRDDTPAQLARAGGRPNGPLRRWFRRFRLGLGLTLAAAVLYYFVCLFQVWSTGGVDDAGPVDAIVVMGAAQYDGRPSPQLRARLDHVAELWPDEIAPLVVVTGGNIPGDRFTEAEASATYLIDLGVPEDALLLEDEGTNSFESLESVSEMLSERGLERVLVVTDPYHALRSRMIAEEVGMIASVSSTDTTVVTGGDSLWRHVQEAGGVAIGRIIGFEALTDLVD